MLNGGLLKNFTGIKKIWKVLRKFIFACIAAMANFKFNFFYDWIYINFYFFIKNI